MSNTITTAMIAAAQNAVGFAPVPPPKPRNYGATRDDWRKHQSDKLLPFERFIFVDKTRSWDHYSPLEKGGEIKQPHELQDLVKRLVPYNEAVWFVHGKPHKDAKGNLTRNVIAVILDGAANASPYLLVAADKPGLKVSVDGKKLRFEGAKLIENIDGEVIEGDTLAFDAMPAVTLRTHDKGGKLAVKNTDPAFPLSVTVKDSECEIERPKEEVCGEVFVERNGKTVPVDLKPVKVAVKAAAKGR